jgi:putative copper export protein
VAPIDLASVVVRAAAFISALAAVGLAWFQAGLVRDSADRARVARWTRIIAAAGTVLVLGHRALDAGRLLGEWSGVLDHRLQALVWSHPPGTSSLVEAAGLLVVALSPRRLVAVQILGGLAVILGFALTGHVTAAAYPRTLQVTLAVHVALVAFWFGGLVGLLISRELADVSARFSRAALGLVPWVALMGVALVVGLVPTLSALRTTYGSLLVVKALGFTVVLAAAAFNRLRMVPAIARREPRARARLRRIVAFEASLLAVLLAVTATMTALFSCH